MESEGPQTCTYTHWVDKIDLVCVNCGEVVATDSVHHERHDLCGAHY